MSANIAERIQIAIVDLTEVSEFSDDTVASDIAEDVKNLLLEMQFLGIPEGKTGG